MKKNFSNFTEILLFWSKNDNKRIMPWKGELNPYKIWLSEIILQQTKVEQGLSYYVKFIKAYPTINKLAVANENDVFKMWEGLGYYSRCRNLLATAKNITENYAGVFPKEYDRLLSLQGVGPYTAAAIASFAYNLPHAVVDGNVYRVLARYFGIPTAIDSKEGKANFNKLANDLLDKKNPAAYNQAIMDFGATICKPKLPLCASCVFKKTCAAFKNNQVNILPVKESKLIKKKRFFYYIIAKYGNQIYIKKRTEKDIWQNLWEFIVVELESKLEVEEFIQSTFYKAIIPSNSAVKKCSPFYKQQLTHQTIEGCFIVVNLKKPLTKTNCELVSISDLKKLAFPRFITTYFEKNPTL
jgi:A/G-specific adenine glycosylase